MLHIARLCHEARDHPVKHNVVIGPGARQFLDPRDMLRRKIWQQLYLDVPFIGTGDLDHQNIFRVRLRKG